MIQAMKISMIILQDVTKLREIHDLKLDSVQCQFYETCNIQYTHTVFKRASLAPLYSIFRVKLILDLSQRKTQTIFPNSPRHKIRSKRMVENRCETIATNLWIKILSIALTRTYMYPE